MTRRLCRAAAVLIAIAGVIDPVISYQGSVPPPLSIVVISAGAGVVEGKRPAGDARWAAAQRLRAAVDDSYDVSLRTHHVDSDAAACPHAGGCVIVSDGRVPSRLTDGASVAGAVRVSIPAGPDVVITGVDAPERTSLQANARMHVALRAVRRPAASLIRVLDGEATVGEATYEWPKDSSGSADARVSIDWVPLTAGVRRLRVSVGPIDAPDERSDVDVGVDVNDQAATVLMHEPEATWNGTFVRRALEADPRLRLEGRTRLAPRVAVAHGTARELTPDALERVGTVVVTAPDLLSASDVALLVRFVRARGGSVILLPDRTLTGPVASLVPAFVLEPVKPVPQAVGPLRATELLRFDASAAGVTTLESFEGQPVIVARDMGRGRVIVSGALDAWRHRDMDRGFVDFWVGLVVDAAVAAGPTLGMRVQPLLQRGETASVEVDWRALDSHPDVTVEAVAHCPSGQRPLRLWPRARHGTFAGVFEADEVGECSFVARVAGTAESAVARALVVDERLRPAPDGAALDAAVGAHGGLVVQSGEEARLADHVRASLPPTTAQQEGRPLRSPYWIVVFAGCLGAEWWLRRRAGLS
jgi:hypothetical protein